MVIIIRFFSICVISIFLLASCPHPCLDLSRLNQLYAVHRSYIIENWKLRIENFVAFGRFKFHVSRLVSLTLLWLGIVNKFPLLSLCAMFRFDSTRSSTFGLSHTDYTDYTDLCSPGGELGNIIYEKCLGGGWQFWVLHTIRIENRFGRQYN